MAIFRWGHSWDAFQDVEREVDRLLQSVNLTFQGFRFGRQYPPINLYELHDTLLLTAEVPGTRAEDLSLTISNGVLTLAAQRTDAENVSDDRFRRRERPHGSWQRSLEIPVRVREDKLTAEFDNGVLTIHLPKVAKTKPRQIPIVEGETGNAHDDS